MVSLNLTDITWCVCVHKTELIDHNRGRNMFNRCHQYIMHQYATAFPLDGFTRLIIYFQKKASENKIYRTE